MDGLGAHQMDQKGQGSQKEEYAQRHWGDKELREMWMKCGNESAGSQAGDAGVGHMIKNLKTRLWISSFVSGEGS